MTTFDEQPATGAPCTATGRDVATAALPATASGAASRMQVLAGLLADSDDGRLVPVSLGQRRLWFVDRLVPGGVDYNVVWPLRLVGALRVAALVSAVGEVVRRHEVLRSRFAVVDGEPVAVVSAAGVVDVEVVDLSGLPVDSRAGEVARWVREAGLRPFDVAVGPLTRWVLLRVSDAEHVLLMSAHHIVFDGWSGSVLLRELSVLYDAFVRGVGSPLAELPVQFADFAVWERQWLSGDVLAEQLGFWREYLAGAPAVLDLPTDHVRPARRGGGGDRERFEFPVGLSEQLAGLCRDEGVTVFMALLAGLQVVLGRYTGSDDVVVGTFVANRAAPELEELIGFFVNTVVLRGDLSGRPSFRELLARVRSGALEVFAHQDVPFDRVVEELHPQRQPGSTPYVQVALVVQNLPAEESRFGDVVVESLPTETRTAAFDLSFHVWPTGSGAFAGFVEFATDLYTRPSVTRLVGHLVSVLSQAVADPDAGIDTLSLPTPTEHHHLTRDAARGAVRHFGPETVVARFARVAQATPDAPAYVDAQHTLSYGDLDDRSTRLARRLRALGVGAESPVGVCLEQGLDLPVAVLAVWKAGGAYLPLDPENPPERLAYMLDDAGAAAVVTTAQLRSRLPAYPAAVIVPGPDAPNDADAVSQPPTTSLDSLAAIIYTSGSTGRPKGVAVTGRAVVNRIAWFADERPFTAGDMGCLKTPIGFVDSLWELLGGLLYGVPTAVIGRDAGRDPKALVQALSTHAVTRLLLVPSLLRMLLVSVDDLAERLPRLSLWISSGEPLSAELAGLFVQTLPGRALHNLYGAAEGWDSLWPPAFNEQESGGVVPVGRPVANVSAHILDRAGHPVPVGVPGELYVGGDCLARGYLGRPDLTAERFLPHPYRGGARMYRTGDLARMQPDGRIQLVGRVDQQLKIRGVRVEPGEVERALEAMPEIDQAVVVAWTRSPALGSEPELAAYVVAHGPPPALPQLRAELGRSVPSHLVPTSFTFLEALPTTPTGKIDRLALPRPVPVPSDSRSEPADDAERLLARTWADLLGLPWVDVHDDFFDIGGHSLLAAQLVDRVGRDIGRELPLRTVFDHSTVRRMNMALRALDAEPERPLC
jgi:amino acid adenylation domain-containing protein